MSTKNTQKRKEIAIPPIRQADGYPCEDQMNKNINNYTFYKRFESKYREQERQLVDIIKQYVKTLKDEKITICLRNGWEDDSWAIDTYISATYEEDFTLTSCDDEDKSYSMRYEELVDEGPFHWTYANGRNYPLFVAYHFM